MNTITSISLKLVKRKRKKSLPHSDHATEPKREHAFFEDRERGRKKRERRRKTRKKKKGIRP